MFLTLNSFINQWEENPSDKINVRTKRKSISTAAMAEWLRRWTWNPMGYPRAGSNPARSVNILQHFCNLFDHNNSIQGIWTTYSMDVFPFLFFQVIQQ